MIQRQFEIMLTKQNQQIIEQQPLVQQQQPVKKSQGIIKNQQIAAKSIRYHRPYQRLARRLQFEACLSDIDREGKSEKDSRSEREGRSQRTNRQGRQQRGGKLQRRVDNFALFDAVMKRGGFQSVCAGRRWQQIYISLIYENSSHGWAKHYQQCLLGFEQQLRQQLNWYGKEILLPLNTCEAHLLQSNNQTVSYYHLTASQHFFMESNFNSLDEYFNIKTIVLLSTDYSLMPTQYTEKVIMTKKWLFFANPLQTISIPSLQLLGASQAAQLKVVIVGVSLASLLLASILADYSVSVTIVDRARRQHRLKDDFQLLLAGLMLIQGGKQAGSYHQKLAKNCALQELQSQKMRLIDQQGKFVSEQKLRSTEEHFAKLLNQFRGQTLNKSSLYEQMTELQSERPLIKWHYDRYMLFNRIRGDATTVAELASYQSKKYVKHVAQTHSIAILRSVQPLLQHLQRHPNVSFLFDNWQSINHNGSEWELKLSADKMAASHPSYEVEHPNRLMASHLIYADQQNIGRVVVQGCSRGQNWQLFGQQGAFMAGQLVLSKCVNCLFRFRDKLVLREGLSGISHFSIHTPEGHLFYFVTGQSQVLGVMCSPNPAIDHCKFILAVLQNKCLAKNNRLASQPLMSYQHTFGLKDEKNIEKIVKIKEKQNMFVMVPITTTNCPHRTSAHLDLVNYVASNMLHQTYQKNSPPEQLIKRLSRTNSSSNKPSLPYLNSSGIPSSNAAIASPSIASASPIIPPSSTKGLPLSSKLIPLVTKNSTKEASLNSQDKQSSNVDQNRHAQVLAKRNSSQHQQKLNASISPQKKQSNLILQKKESNLIENKQLITNTLHQQPSIIKLSLRPTPIHPQETLIIKLLLPFTNSFMQEQIANKGEIPSIEAVYRLNPDWLGLKHNFVQSYQNYLTLQIKKSQQLPQALVGASSFELQQPLRLDEGVSGCLWLYSLGRPSLTRRQWFDWLCEDQVHQSELVLLDRMVTRRQYFSLGDTLKTTIYYQTVISLNRHIYYCIVDEENPSVVYFHTDLHKLISTFNSKLSQIRDQQLSELTLRVSYSNIRVTRTSFTHNISHQLVPSLVHETVRQQIAQSVDLDQLLKAKLNHPQVSISKHMAATEIPNIMHQSSGTMQLQSLGRQEQYQITQKIQKLYLDSTGIILGQVMAYLQGWCSIYQVKVFALWQIFFGVLSEQYMACEIMRKFTANPLSLPEVAKMDEPLSKQLEQLFCKNIINQMHSIIISPNGQAVITTRNFLHPSRSSLFAPYVLRQTIVNSVSQPKLQVEQIKKYQLLLPGEQKWLSIHPQDFMKAIVGRLCNSYAPHFVIQTFQQLVSQQLANQHTLTARLKMYYRMTKKNLKQRPPDSSKMQEKCKNLTQQQKSHAHSLLTKRRITWLENDFVFIVS